MPITDVVLKLEVGMPEIIRDETHETLAVTSSTSPSNRLDKLSALATKGADLGDLGVATIQTLRAQGLSPEDKAKLDHLAVVITDRVGGSIHPEHLTPSAASAVGEAITTFRVEGNTAALGNLVVELFGGLRHHERLALTNLDAFERAQALHAARDVRGEPAPTRQLGNLDGMARELLTVYANRWNRFPALAEFNPDQLQPNPPPGEAATRVNPLLLLQAGQATIQQIARHEEHLDGVVRKGLSAFLERLPKMVEGMGLSPDERSRIGRDMKFLRRQQDKPWTFSPNQRRSILAICGFWELRASQDGARALGDGTSATDQAMSPGKQRLAASLDALRSMLGFQPDPERRSGSFAAGFAEAREEHALAVAAHAEMVATVGKDALPEVKERLASLSEDMNGAALTLRDFRGEMNRSAIAHHGYVRLEFLQRREAIALNEALGKNELDTTIGVARLCASALELYRGQHKDGYFPDGRTKEANILMQHLLNYNRRDESQKRPQIEAELLRAEDVNIRAATAAMDAFSAVLAPFRNEAVAAKMDPALRLACDMYLLEHVVPRYLENIQTGVGGAVEAFTALREDVLASEIGGGWQKFERADWKTARAIKGFEKTDATKQSLLALCKTFAAMESIADSMLALCGVRDTAQTN